jgi:predicted phage tail protein|tara:strand:+ start:9588 stop:10397 length:810 start_codon:yes stop_codon:yes gene_type:complete
MNKVKIKVHGVLKKQLRQEQWILAVDNVSEAIRGIQSNCKDFYPTLVKNDKKNIKYRVLINEKDFIMDEDKNPDTREGLLSSELCLSKISDLKTIDIIPIVEGSDDWMDWVLTIIGIALIFVGGYGMMTAAGGMSSMSAFGISNMSLTLMGIGLVAAGVGNLLSPDPEFDDFREVEGGGRPSYVFSGPQNVIQEGGPVFVGYGRLLVGSQVIQTSVDYLDAEAGVFKNKDANGKVIWGETKYGLKYNIPQIGSAIRQYEGKQGSDITKD